MDNQFYVNSGTIILADPCVYDESSNIECNIKVGLYKVTPFYQRDSITNMSEIFKFRVLHSDYSDISKLDTIEKTSLQFFCASSKIGIFDQNFYESFTKTQEDRNYLYDASCVTSNNLLGIGTLGKASCICSCAIGDYAVFPLLSKENGFAGILVGLEVIWGVDSLKNSVIIS